MVKLKPPKVTVFCLAYNQAKYIRQCLDGILTQETNFGIEILINDDASSDGTRRIIQEYAKKHPGIIKPVLQKTNQYSKGKRNFIIRYLMPKMRGEYLAICEGDDYWTDPKKLQKQVDFLDANPDYALCFHKVLVKYEDGSVDDQVYPDVANKSWYTRAQLLKLNYIQTNSVMYRRQAYDDVSNQVTPGDWYLHLYHAQFGKIKLIDEVMSVYRKHKGGMWWDYDRDRTKIWRTHGIAHLTMWVELQKFYSGNSNHIKIIQGHVDEMIDILLDIDRSYRSDNISEVIRRFPDETARYMKLQSKRVADMSDEVKSQQESIGVMRYEVDKMNQILSNREAELARIKSTKTWRMRRAVGQTVIKSGIRKKEV
jgi:glycosyltransferase involved in cell wall biosynthesis